MNRYGPVPTSVCSFLVTTVSVKFFPRWWKDKPRQTAQAESEQNERTFLPTIQTLACVGANSVVNAEGNKQSDDDEKCGAKKLVVHGQR